MRRVVSKYGGWCGRTLLTTCAYHLATLSPFRYQRHTQTLPCRPAGLHRI